MGREHFKDAKRRNPLRTFKGFSHTVLSEMRERSEAGSGQEARRLDDELSEIKTDAVLQTVKDFNGASGPTEVRARRTGRQVGRIGKRAIGEAFAHSS